MSNYLTSRFGRVGAIVVFTVLAPATISATPALAAAGEGCPNERVRQESNVNPSTGQPYSVGLPECRAYEMVSPLEKGGSDALPSPTEEGGTFPVAANGNAAKFFSQVAFGDAETAKVGGFGIPGNSYVSRRGARGWITSSATAPHALIAKLQDEQDASPGNLSTVSNCGINAVNNVAAGNAVACALRNGIGPWVSTPLYPNLTGGIDAQTGGNAGIEYRGGSTDLATLIFASAGSTGSAFLPADTSEEGKGLGIYEVTGAAGATSELSLVNVNNSGEEIGPEHLTQLGGSALIPDDPCEIEAKSSYFGSDYQAVSSSGTVIYFTACPSGAENVDTVYARVNGTSTVTISNPSPSQCGPACSVTPRPAEFVGASADGAKAFFMTEQPLVDGDEGGTGSGMDLYEYDLYKPPGANLVQLSAGGAGDLTPGSGAEVQGVVRTSADGSHVYFVAKGVLTTVPNGVGAIPQAGADNLYAVDIGTSETKFVADLCSNASASGSVSDTQCPATLNGETFNGTNDTALWGSDTNAQSRQVI